MQNLAHGVLMLDVRLCQLIHAEVASDVQQIAPNIATVESLPIDFITGFLSKLLGESAKGATVAIAERVNIIQFGINLGKPRCKFKRF